MLTRDDYTVAWLCALPKSELVAATAMLDQEHPPLSLPLDDDNTYLFGSINGHNVVIACLPPGQPGKVSAARLVQPIKQSFPKINIHLFVGVGAGVPRRPIPRDPIKDVHLGDVVVGWAEHAGDPGVVQWDYVRFYDEDKVESLGSLDKPERRLLNAFGVLLANHESNKTKFAEHLERVTNRSGFSHPGISNDKLYKSTYSHNEESTAFTCDHCDDKQLVEREARKDTGFVFHQGTIVSGDSVMRNAQQRDRISSRFHDAWCIEMEAAGVMDEKRCLVVRGIADYADSHKNKIWHKYAAATAAAFAREFLYTIQPHESKAIPTRHEPYFLAPLPSIEEFTGREEYMSRFESMYNRNSHARIALYGLSGIGKTRIALETVYKLKGLNSTSIFWVHAGASERMKKGYLDVAKTVGITGWDSLDPKIDKLKLVKNWFESEISGHWILVLDNADDIDLLYKEQNGSTRLADYFPKSQNGTILLTTRNKQVAINFTKRQNIVLVEALNIDESVSLLKAKVGDDFNECDYDRLARTLCHVPLALVQAAAFISAQSLSISRYLSLYDKSDAFKIDLIGKDFEDDVRDRDSQNAVSATLAISFEHIKKSNPRAADMLSIMSMLDTQTIPTSLLPFDEDMLSIEVLGTLQAFSLITKAFQQEQEDQSFDMHRLVRLAMHSWLRASGELKSWARRSIVIMSERFPPGRHANRNICRFYLPHALTVLSSEQILSDRRCTEALQPLRKVLTEVEIAQAALQYKVAWHFRTMGDFSSAEPIARRSLVTRTTALGKEHPQTLESMSILASVLKIRGKYEEAEEISRQTFVLSKTTLGKEHTETLKCMNQLATVLSQRGKYEEAEEMHLQQLALREKVSGKEHPETLTSMGNLASVFGDRGKYEEAEKMNRQTLALRETVLGKEHPGTLTSMSNLALVLGGRGKYEEAEEMGRQTFASRETVLGREHPDTLTSMNNLAWVLDKRGKYEEAEEMYRQTFASRETVLGKEHRSTLASMSGLRSALEKQGKHEETKRYQRTTATV